MVDGTVAFGGFGVATKLLELGVGIAKFKIKSPNLRNEIKIAILLAYQQHEYLKKLQQQWRADAKTSLERLPDHLADSLEQMWGKELTNKITQRMQLLIEDFAFVDKLLKSFKSEMAELGDPIAADAESGTRNLWEPLPESSAKVNIHPKSYWNRLRKFSGPGKATDAASKDISKGKKVDVSTKSKLKWVMTHGEQINSTITRIDNHLKDIETASEEHYRHKISFLPRKMNPDEFKRYSETTRHLHNKVQLDKKSLHIHLRLDLEARSNVYFTRTAGNIDFVDGSSIKSALLLQKLKAPSESATLKFGFVVVESIHKEISHKAHDVATKPSLQEIFDLVHAQSKQDDPGTATRSYRYHAAQPSDEAGSPFAVFHLPPPPHLKPVVTLQQKQPFSFKTYLEGEAYIPHSQVYTRRLSLAWLLSSSLHRLRLTGWLDVNFDISDIGFYGDFCGDTDTLLQDLYLFLLDSRCRKLRRVPAPIALPPSIENLEISVSHNRALRDFIPRLGIVLWEVGSGKLHEQLVAEAHLSELVIEDIKKIPLGLEYQSLVEMCFNGVLYLSCLKAENSDSKLYEIIVKHLARIQKHGKEARDSGYFRIA